MTICELILALVPALAYVAVCLLVVVRAARGCRICRDILGLDRS